MAPTGPSAYLDSQEITQLRTIEMMARTKVALAAALIILTAVGVAQAAGQLYLADIVFNWLTR